MIPLRSIRSPRTNARTALIAGLAAAVLLLGILFYDPAAALRGVLAVFLFSITIPAGSMALLLIHRLTGGRWGEAARPVLEPAAAALPLVSLALLPVLLALPLVYPWAADPSLIRHEDVARWYLNPPAFAARSIAALAIWSVFALLAARRSTRLGAALAGLGLLLYGLTLSLVSVDWFLSFDPHFKSTAFAMSAGLSQLLGAIALVGLAGTHAKDVTADLFKLLVAFAMGLLYLDLMQFLVIYDGNLPDKAAWYLRRDEAIWLVLIALAFITAALLPFVAALRDGWRSSPRVLTGVSAAVLLGLLARTIWLVAPEWHPGLSDWLAMGLAFAAVGGIGVGRSGSAKIPFVRLRREASHGA